MDQPEHRRPRWLVWDISVSAHRSALQSTPVMPRTHPHHPRRLQAPRHPYSSRFRYPPLLLVFLRCSEGGTLRVAVHRDFGGGPRAIGTGRIARILAKTPCGPVVYVAMPYDPAAELQSSSFPKKLDFARNQMLQDSKSSYTSHFWRRITTCSHVHCALRVSDSID